jgi:hypothetical protein
MKNWAKQLAGAILVVVFALAVGGFVLLLRAQQGSLAATMAAAHIRAVSPPDGATNILVDGEIRADYVSRPRTDPTIKLEPPVGVTLDNPRWEGTTFVVDYHGLRDTSLYHVELDQDDSTGKGEHKQIKVRWSFRTGPGQHATPTATPTPSPTSATTVSPSAAPTTSGPLIWYGGPSNDLHGVDWTGKQVKNLSANLMIQSPDGLLLWRRPNTPGGNSAVYDANGDPVGFVPADPNMMWADDGRTFCSVTSTPTGTHELDMLRINGPRIRVGAVPVTPGTNQVPVLAACSVLTQRAVVIGQSNGYTWSVTMISLNDGSVLYQHSYPNPLARIVASHDGQYIAEQYGSNASGAATLIRQLPSGTTVGQFSGVVVQGFSWDGTLVVGNTSGDLSVQEAQVMRYRTHEIVWHQCTCPHPHGLFTLPQPGGSKLAVVAITDDGLHVLFTIVDAGGTSKSIPVAAQSLPLF